MTDNRRLFGRPTCLGLMVVSFVSVAACGGDAVAPVADTEIAAAEMGTASDWVDRQLPNPTGEVLLNWAALPDNREWGSTAGIDIDPDGNIWAYDRCGGLALAGGCEENSDRDPVFKFNKDTGEIINAVLAQHNKIIEFYRYMASRAEVPSTQALMTNLLELEQNEARRMARDAGELDDL